MKICTVVGARPQFIKAAAVSRQLRADPATREVLVHTGQHFDPMMSEVFFAELEIPAPDHHLGIHGGGHGAMTGEMLKALEPVLQDEAPDWVLVYGDTNSTLAAALAAVKLHIPVAHVEAGLRSFNRRMPEEINRVLTDHASTLLFAPTGAAVANLLAEGVTAGVHRVGDVMYDAALHYGARAERESTVLERLGVRRGEYLLCTVHRAENTDDPARLDALFAALCDLAGELPVVLPLHPRTRGVLERRGALAGMPQGLRITEPVGYLDMVMLERNARAVATDSGGVQKEAYFYGVPCITLRDETEWVELVDAGWNAVVPPLSAAAVADGIRARLGTRGRDESLYGDGTAAAAIARALREYPGGAAAPLAGAA